MCICVFLSLEKSFLLCFVRYYIKLCAYAQTQRIIQSHARERVFRGKQRERERVCVLVCL